MDAFIYYCFIAAFFLVAIFIFSIAVTIVTTIVSAIYRKNKVIGVIAGIILTIVGLAILLMITKENAPAIKSFIESYEMWVCELLRGG